MSQPPAPNSTTNDCYSAGERAAMERNQELRGRLLRPLLAALTRARITPDAVTILSTAAGLGFCPAWFVSPVAAFGLLLAHVLLDGLDGPLARFQGVASRKGSFTDTMADQTVIFATTLTLMSVGVIGIVPGSVYLFTYTLVVAFAMIRNALEIPYSWLVRPRFVVYCWLVVETFWLPGTVDLVLYGFNALLALKLLSGFYNLRRRLGEIEAGP